MRRTKQEVVSEFRSNEILVAARKVFARKGFAGATVDEIADAANVAKGTVYLYFPSKREIYLAAFRLGWEKLIEETRRNVEAAPDPQAKLRAFIGTRIHYAERNRDFISIFHAEFGNIGPSCANKKFKTLYLEQARDLEAMLERAAADGKIRPMRNDTAAFAVYEMTRGLVTQRLLGWSKASAEEDIQFLFELIWSGMAPAPAAANGGLVQETYGSATDK